MKKTLPLLASALALAAAAAHSDVPMMPTIGRVVHYYPQGLKDIENGAQPCAGLITQVWGDRYDNGRICVNVAYVNSGGTWSSASSAWLYHPDATVPEEDGGFALWIPFQAKQVAKSEVPAGPLDVQLVKIEDNGEPVGGGEMVGLGGDGATDGADQGSSA